MILKACLYLFMLPWQRHIRQLSSIKNPKVVLLNWVLSFLATKASRVLEKKENETQISILCSNCLRSIGNQGRFAIGHIIFVLQISKGACDSKPVFQKVNIVNGAFMSDVGVLHCHVNLSSLTNTSKLKSICKSS